MAPRSAARWSSPIGLTAMCLGIFVGLLQLRLPILGEWTGG